MATHFSTLAWKIPWTEEPGGLQSMGCLIHPGANYSQAGGGAWLWAAGPALWHLLLACGLGGRWRQRPWQARGPAG